jgi:hypothetical protein
MNVGGGWRRMKKEGEKRKREKNEARRNEE